MQHYTSGKTHSGLIDSLGLDENDCPVILEYKRSSGENVINQGLFYLDWLMDHRGDFERLVTRQSGHEAADVSIGADRGWCVSQLISRSMMPMPCSRSIATSN
jgi:RecB family endonuclease NucS